MKKITIYWYQTEQGLINSNRLKLELNKLLKQAGSSIEFDIQCLPDDIVNIFRNWDGQQSPFDTLINHIYSTTGDFEGFNNRRFLIATNTNSVFYDWAKKEVPHADWGVCDAERVAIDYSPVGIRLINQIHECLHFLGVDDCYDSTMAQKLSCDNDQCIMQYGKSSIEICDSVIKQLKRAQRNTPILGLVSKWAVKY